MVYLLPLVVLNPIDFHSTWKNAFINALRAAPGMQKITPKVVAISQSRITREFTMRHPQLH